MIRPISVRWPVLFVALVAPTARALPQADQPRVFASGGGVPMIGVVERIKDGELGFRETHMIAETRTYTVQVQEPVDVQGKTEMRTMVRQQTRTVYKAVSVENRWPLAAIRVFDTNGKPIDAARVPGLFPHPTMVLFARAGQPIDPGYLKIARAGTPFVVLPEPQPEPVQPVPEPAPPAPRRPT
jgi:hypothetical protein